MNTKISLAVSQAVPLIRSSPRIYLGTHLRPDGDALGSLLGLALALEASGLQVARLCMHPCPENYCFLPGAERLASQAPDWPADLGIAVDCDGLKRLGSVEEAFAALPHLVDIDHHATEQSFGDVRVIDPTAAATAEIVYELILQLGVPITPDIATCLYAGVLTDTGRFSFSNTTPRSFAVAAELVAHGANPAQIADRIYFQRSYASARLLGIALSRLRLDRDGQIISSVLHAADFTETGALQADTEGIIDRIRMVGGPLVAAFFTQTEDGETRVSLRSNGRPDVSRVALKFGGGGHAPAAGCTLTTDPEMAAHPGPRHVGPGSRGGFGWLLMAS